MSAIIVRCLGVYASRASQLQSEVNGINNDARTVGIYAMLDGRGAKLDEV